MSHRVNVTIPEEVESLFEWMLKYDAQFKGKEAAVVAHFFAKGIKASYEEDLRNADPLDADTFTEVAEHTRQTLKKAAG